MREGKQLLYFVAVFFFFSLFLTGGKFEEKEIRTLKNVFILNWKENKIRILLDGQEKVYICDEYARKEKVDIPADIIMRGERVLQVRAQERETIQTFKLEKTEENGKNRVNILGINKEQRKKVLTAARKRWTKEVLFGYELI